MPDPQTTSIPLDRPAIHVDVQPGAEIVVRGFYAVPSEAATIDAATTSRTVNGPDPVADPGGLIDFEAGGFHLTSRDLATHEVHAIATGTGGEACAQLGVQAPCLVNRLQTLASRRLMTVAEFRPKLLGPPQGLTLVTPTPPPFAPPPAAVPWLGVTLGVAVAGLIGLVAWRRRKRFAASPSGQLLALAERVRGKLARADAVVAAPLAPAIETALRAVRGRRVDPSSPQGRRVAEVLVRVEARLDETVELARAEQEKQAADELVRDVEAALEAADEATVAIDDKRSTAR